MKELERYKKAVEYARQGFTTIYGADCHSIKEMEDILAPPQEFENVEVVRWASIGVDGEIVGCGSEQYCKDMHPCSPRIKLTGTIRRPVPQKVERSVSVNGEILDDGGFEVNRPFDVFPECHGKTGTLTFTWEE